jgi:hypothetical protein
VTDVLADDGPTFYAPGSAERGKFVHAACHLLVTTGLDRSSVPEKWAGYVRAFERFLVECDVDPLHSSFKVENVLLGYCGEGDLICRFRRSSTIGRHSWLIDLKTGNVPWTVGMQTAAYLHATNLVGSSARRGAVQLMSSGKYGLFLEGMSSIFTPFDFIKFRERLSEKQVMWDKGTWFPRERED